MLGLTESEASACGVSSLATPARPRGGAMILELQSPMRFLSDIQWLMLSANLCSCVGRHGRSRRRWKRQSGLVFLDGKGDCGKKVITSARLDGEKVM